MFYRLSFVLMVLVSCSKAKDDHVTEKPDPEVTHPTRLFNLGPYPPISSNGEPGERLNWLFSLPFKGAIRLKQATMDGKIQVVISPQLGVPATFGKSKPEDIMHGSPPYTVTFGASLFDDRLMLDVAAATAHEGVHVGQCLDEGRCPEDTSDQRMTQEECGAKWRREFEGYRESCIVFMASKIVEPRNCNDDRVIAELTMAMMQDNGQFASRPECQAVWQKLASN